MDEGSLFSILLSTKQRLPRWMRIEKWKGLRNTKIEHIGCESCVFIRYLMRNYNDLNVPYHENYIRAIKVYKLSKLGPFWPFCGANLYHTSRITGRCAENDWLKLPWDVWKLILRHLPYNKEFMAPVCTYFRDRYKKETVACTDTYPVDVMHWRCQNFINYQPRRCKKPRLRNGPHVAKKQVCPFVFDIYAFTLSFFPDTRPRRRNTIVAAKRFQEFEWRPG